MGIKIMGENRRLRVFLCHSSNDKPIVRDVYKLLTKENWIIPWLDEVSLRPGQDWKFEIENAINKTDVVIVFLSRNSVSKEGFVQKEIKNVLDKFDEKPAGTIYIIPIRIEECEVPKRLADLHWVDISISNAEWYSPLLESLRLKAKNIGISFQHKDETDKESYELNKELIERYKNLLSDFQLMEGEHQKAKRALEIKEVEIKAILAQAHEIAYTDEVTYLPNRRKIMVDLQEEVIRSAKHNNALSIILIELDQYNVIRTSHDRFVADAVLREFADILKELIYRPNTIGRLEGGEFLIVLPASDISGATKMGESLIERARSKPIDSHSVDVTASAGVVQFLQGQEILEAMIQRADKAIRNAKKSGGNQWVVLK